MVVSVVVADGGGEIWTNGWLRRPTDGGEEGNHGWEDGSADRRIGCGGVGEGPTDGFAGQRMGETGGADSRMRWGAGVVRVIVLVIVLGAGRWGRLGLRLGLGWTRIHGCCGAGGVFTEGKENEFYR